KLSNDSARLTGYVKEDPVAVGGGGGFYYFMPTGNINDNKPLSASSLGSLSGGAGGFMVNLNPNLAVGGLFGGLGSGSSTKVGTTYYDFSVGAAFELAQLQYKPIINDSFILGLDLGVGFAQGSYQIYQTDETSISQDTIRSGNGLAMLCGVDLRKRLTNFFFTGIKLGWLSTSFDSLKRGDFVDPGKKQTISAYYLAVTLGGNF
ncbi:MAG: hypothetical protein KKD13_03110, partial [Candidatus Margulisbacteria bacterium]|nr:hypothetical protein [Candidatus Margulisiibacteriota bacterium]